MTIGATIDKLNKLRNQKRDLEKQVSDIASDMSEIELQLIEMMDKEGVAKSTGKTASVSISESVKPSVEDWDRFYAYIHRMKYYHLLERRPAVAACRELFTSKGKIPGVSPFTQRRLNLRQL